MDLRSCLTIVCLLGLAVAAPVAQQDTRNYIPDRYDVHATLINADGSFSRQEPPPPAEDKEQQSFDQFGNGQENNLAYQPQNDYQIRQQVYNNNQEPGGYPVGAQDKQASFYNTQQFPAESTADMQYSTRAENDDISRGEQEDNPAEYSNQQPQQFQNYQTYNNQPAAPQTQEQSYFSQPQQQPQQYQQQFYQPQTEVSDDTQGTLRDQPASDQQARDKSARDEKVSDDDESDDLSHDRDDEDEVEKRSEIVKERIKKYSIPKNLSQKDLEGMLGFEKQIYLRGGQ